MLTTISRDMQKKICDERVGAIMVSCHSAENVWIPTWFWLFNRWPLGSHHTHDQKLVPGVIHLSRSKDRANAKILELFQRSFLESQISFGCGSPTSTSWIGTYSGSRDRLPSDCTIPVCNYLLVELQSNVCCSFLWGHKSQNCAPISAPSAVRQPKTIR